ncbi:hypothetical protein NLI96_g6248 [Meripilus lineatus]|uniref:Uncharacterized protein n=1 Tax=Meripilus lineatus TaxID=2056292 RepID=A0AAD5V674_9APHY|nr:hypothetical protein NLI96_g6248 [Physisporinus lineatus]
MPPSQSKNGNTQVVIIGAGVGGLSAGIALKRQLGLHAFKILEQAEDIGGTWHDNTYPGCASDIDTHWYSLSTDLNPHWASTHVSQPELKEYWKQLASKYSLYDQLVLNRQVTSVDWDNQQQLYKITSQDSKSKKIFNDAAQIVICATGILYVPFVPPELESIKKFRGSAFHSARWDNTIDLHNKRVAVVGNGCSATQLVPIIAKDPTTQVVNFCRTPHWYLRSRWGAFPESVKWVFAHVPLAMPFGCRRFVIDSGYLSALHQSNLDLNYDGIAEFTEGGIISKKGKGELNAVVECTECVAPQARNPALSPYRPLTLADTQDKFPLKVRGSEGITVQEYYDRKGGPEAYLGVTLPGFPNFFMIAGPNSATGHASVIFTEEVQINYIMQFVKPIVKQLASSFEITTRANDEFNSAIQKKLSKSIWSNCLSWYRFGHTGKIITQWPGTMTEYWWNMRTPIWSHYKAFGHDEIRMWSQAFTPTS